MKIEFLLSVCLIFVTIIKCENFENSLEFQILKELTQEDKKCIKTAGEVIFILDGSTSVGPDNFNKEKDFATQIVNRLVIGNNLTRVALITYNSVPQLVFNVDKYNNSKDVNREILKAEFTEGITVVGDALNMVLTDIESKTRRSTGKVIILISDGKRNGGMDPILVAKQLKALSYMLITIGLDKETDENSMIAISDKKNFYLIKDFDSLPKIVSTIVQKTCTGFHISKCSPPIVKKGPCVNKEQINVITTFYYYNGKCVSENRKLTVKCLGPKDCPDPYYQKTSCGSANYSFILFHNFSRVNDLCRTETVNLKKYSCGCSKPEESVLKVVYGKECENGYKKRMLLYYEFSQFKCSETYLNLEPVKCDTLCNGTTLVTSPCVNGKRNNTIYTKVFTNNKCSLKIVKTTESFCDTICPKSLIIESKECVNNIKDVFHITFQNVNGKCIKQTKKIKSNNCTKIQECPQPKFISSDCVEGKKILMKLSYRLVGGKCQEINERIGNENCSIAKCPKPSYKVEKCDNNQKNTSLIRVAYRQTNSSCVRTQTTVTKLPCQCYRNTETNVTVTFGRQCQNGFLSRVIELNVEKSGKCSKVAFKLRSIRCRKPCDRRRKVEVGKCKSNQRSLTVLRAVREKNRCMWKIVTSKFVKCKNVCPDPKEKRSRCILKKQAIFRVTFKEVGDKCRFSVIRLSVVPCQGCQNSTYRIEKCDKGAKETKLVRTFYQETNRTCVKKEVTVKKLSCRCTGNTTKNINVVVGKQCQRGYITRVLELTEERNDKCVKVAFKLRRIRCQRPCSRKLKLVVNKCVSNKRLIQRVKSVKEGKKCVLKVVNSKTVNCKNLCPLPKEKKSRCIRGKQAVMRLTFRNVGNVCLYSTARVGLVKCQGCPKPSYKVEKCDNNQKNTSLIRVAYRQTNSSCVRTQTTVTKLPCQCYRNTETNVTVTFGRQCQNGFLSRVIELNVEKSGKCSKVAFKLRSIRCKKPCDRRRKVEVGKCKSNQRSLTVLRAVREKDRCMWKIVTSKFVKCKKVCPDPKEKRSRCILKKQAIFRVTFKEVGDKCRFSVIRLSVVPCQGCQNSTYRIEKCDKGAKETKLVRTFYQETNQTCVKKEVIVKKLSCRCTGNTTKNINVVVGKQCQNGYITRVLELTEERNDKCVKVAFKLRRIRCQRPCSRKLKLVVNKCVSNKRLIQRMKSVKEGKKCVLKVVNSKTVNCKNPCPLPKERRTRCIKGIQGVMKITFNLVGNKCNALFVRVNITKCQRCQKTSYKVEKCNNNQKNTSLIRVAYRQTNSSCVRTQTTVTKLPCQCYRNTETNVTVTFGRQCQNGFLSRVIELNVEKSGKCSKVAFKLRSIRCRKPCDRRRKVEVGKCKSNQRSLTVLRAVREKNRCMWKIVTSKFVKCKKVCPDPKEKRSRCILKKQAIFRVTFKEVGDKCRFSVIRLSVVPCQGCQNSTYRIEKCDKGAKETKLVRTFYQETNQTCVKKEVIVKKLSCRCTGNTTKNINVVVGKQCQSGYITRVLELTEERNDKCVKVAFKLRRIRCQRPCSRKLKLVVNKCVSNKRLIQRMKSVKEGKKCVLKVVNSKTVNCKNLCPLPKEKKSRCIRGKQAVMRLTFRNVGNVCLYSTARVGLVKCQGCPKPSYKVEKCNNNQKNTSLIRVAYRQTNSSCVRTQTTVTKLTCQCYRNTETNVTVTFGRQCQNGFLSRVIELNVEKSGKCSKVAFKLRSIRCRKPCDRRRKVEVGKCKSNQRSLTVLRAVREKNRCMWKIVTSKFVKCKKVCPDPKEKRSRCILKKQAIFRVTFKEVGDKCRFSVIRLSVVPCQGCQNSTYRIEKCDKGAKETKLVRTFFQETNQTCVKKEVIVKKLSCRCTGNTTKNINVVVGKQCQNGYITRVLELTEERNDKCVKVAFKLRRIRCQRPCSRKLKLVVNKCVSNKRLIQRMKSVKEGKKCVLKVVNSKTVNCKNPCPLPKERRTRCIKGIQGVMKITFNLVGNKCNALFVRVNITKCQRCPRSVYRIDRCEKNAKETFLIRTFFQSANGVCLRKELKLKTLPCKCYDNVTRNITVIIGPSCQNGYKSRVLELRVEKNQNCIKETFKLRSIKCEGACNRTNQIVGPCFLNKRLVKVLKQIKSNNGSCHWKLLSSTFVNCSHKCPEPQIKTTACINGERFMVRISYQETGGKCEKREQKLQTLKCQTCFRKSVYELMECSKTSKTSELVRTSHRNCTRKVEKLLDVDCLCEGLNNYGLNVTSTANCTNGVRVKTLSFYTTLNGKCQIKSLSIKGGKCGCLGSTFNLSVCVNGNRILEKFTRYQSGSQCLSKLVFSRKIRCRSICPTNSMVLSSKCLKKRKLRVISLFEKSYNQCKLVKFSFKWTKCIIPISGKNCSKIKRLTMSNCQKGKAYIIFTKSAEKPVNGTCGLNSSKIAQVNCTDKCERTIRPKLVAGICEKQIQLVFFIASRPQGKQCLHKINYLGKIGCKNC